MNDDEKLEAITNEVMRLLIKHSFSDVSMYADLAKRIATLIDAEIKFATKNELNRELMQFWGAGLN